MTIDDTGPAPEEALREVLATLIDAFGLDAEVVVEELDGVLRGTITGADVESVVGERGTVIDAVQHLAQRIVLRGGEGLRVVVDAGGYRERREVELRGEADRAVLTAVAERREVALSPMPATERRFVHEYLRDRGDVGTYSEGDEPNRRLIVTPAGA
jgi:spoIIIJ-associated protein